MDRRRFLKIAGAVGGAVVASTLAYEELLGGLLPPQSPTPPAISSTAASSPSSTSAFGSSSTSVGSTPSPSDYTSDYAEFMGWLGDASKPYRGKALNVSLENEPLYLAMQVRDPDFFKTSGINTAYNIQPYTLQVATVSLMVNSAAPTYDAFTVDHQDVAQFKDHVLSPVELADKYPDITYEKLNPQDFFGLPWSMLAVYPPDLSFNFGASSAGGTYFIPSNSPTAVQFYRNDLYQQKGLSVAKTWDDYLGNAQALNSARPIRFGCVDMASNSVSIVQEFLNHLKSFGGDLWEVNGGQLTSGLGSDQALAALENFVRLEPYSDTNSWLYTQDDITTDFAQNAASNALHFGDYAYYLDDHFRSNVSGLVDYAPNPAGQGGAYSTWSGGGLGVSKYSRNPEAAWLWSQWATSLGLQEMTLLGSYHSFPTRKAALGDSQVQAALGTPSCRALSVVNEVWNAGQITTLVPFPRWWDSLQWIGFYLNNAWRGQQTPKQALDLTTQKLSALGSLRF